MNKKIAFSVLARKYHCLLILMLIGAYLVPPKFEDSLNIPRLQPIPLQETIVFFLPS